MIQTIVSVCVILYGIMRISHTPDVPISTIMNENKLGLAVTFLVRLLYFAFENYLVNLFKMSVIQIVNEKLVL